MSTRDDGDFPFHFRDSWDAGIRDAVRSDIDPVGALYEAARRAAQNDQAHRFEEVGFRRVPRLPPPHRRQP
jgi:hypothetical protein